MKRTITPFSDYIASPHLNQLHQFRPGRIRQLGDAGAEAHQDVPVRGVSVPGPGVSNDGGVITLLPDEVQLSRKMMAQRRNPPVRPGASIPTGEDQYALWLATICM